MTVEYDPAAAEANYLEWRRSLHPDDPDWLPPPGTATTSGQLTGRVDWNDLLNGEHAPQDWLVEPFLARGRSHALYAPAKAGKSLLALDIAAAIASGHACLHQPAGPPRPVVYVDLEMTEDDLRERVEALEYTADELALLRYYLLPSLAPLDTPTGGAAILTEATREPCELVVVDTVARAISGPENDADTIRELARHTFMPLKRAGIASLRADHSGKDIGRGQRGTSAKNDDVDVVWQLTAGDANTLTLKATHRRLAWVPETISLTRTADPLRHLTGAPVWPAGTLEAVARLDAISAPLEITVREACKLIGGKTLIVSSAVKYRKFGLWGGETRTGKRVLPSNGKRPPETVSSTPSDLGETPRETLGNGGPGSWETGGVSQRDTPRFPAPDDDIEDF